MNLYLISKKHSWGYYSDTYIVVATNQEDALEQLNLNNFFWKDEDGTLYFPEDLDTFLVNCTEVGTAKENIKRSILLKSHYEKE